MTSLPTGPVAVLDDDVQFIRMVERILASEGVAIQPVTTPDYDDAVKVVAMAECSAALVDIYMYGEAAGFALIERLRQNPATATLPLIVTSGAYRELSKRVPFLREHNCRVLPKPFTVDELLTQLEDACSSPALAAVQTNGNGNGHHEDAQPTPARWRTITNPIKRPLERAS